MATKQQLIDLIRRTQGSTAVGGLSFENDEDFYILLESMVHEHGACGRCRHYFKGDRTCENPSNSRQSCINHLYEVLSEEAKADCFKCAHRRGRSRVDPDLVGCENRTSYANYKTVKSEGCTMFRKATKFELKRNAALDNHHACLCYY